MLLVKKQSLLFLICLFPFISVFSQDGELDYDNCTFDGISLYGKVQIVESFPDIRVEIVDAFPDLSVQKVNAFPDECGEWMFVDAFPDFRIQIVKNFPDVRIQYVNAFPGMEE
ncbi:MAG: hypothetical protein WD048_16870 [Chitinophagales bacterium]